jgi:cytochrome c oxidase subunit I+III
LPNAPTGGRETIVTSPVDGEPQYVIRMPGPSWTHVIAAAFTAAFFLLLTVKVVVPAIACGIIAILACLVWVWELDHGPGQGRVDIGGGMKLPTYMTGPSSHSWWAMVVLMLVAGSLYVAYLFSYLYLWTVSPEVWAQGAPLLPPVEWPTMSAILMVAGVISFAGAGRVLPIPGSIDWRVPVLIFGGAACLLGATAIEILGHWQSGLRPTASAYAAMVYMASALTGQLVFAVVIMTGFAIARYFTGRLDRERRVTFENTALLNYYTAGQGLLGLLIVHGFPRAMG